MPGRRNTEFDYERRSLRSRLREEELDGPRTPFTRGRALDGRMDLSQLRVTELKQLRAPTGEFYFVTGYSKIGGPDIVGP